MTLFQVSTPTDPKAEVYLTLAPGCSTITSLRDLYHYDLVVTGFCDTEPVHDLVPVEVREEIVAAHVTWVSEEALVQEQPKKISMKALLFHVEGGGWRCGPSSLSSEVAFERIQRGSTFKANGRIFSRDGTLWKAGEEMWTPRALEQLLQTLA